MILIGRRHKEHHFRENKRNVVLDHLHILRVSLESVHQHPEMNSVLIVLVWELFRFRIFQGLLLLQCFLLQLRHILDEALLEDDWLEVLKAA